MMQCSITTCVEAFREHKAIVVPREKSCINSPNYSGRLITLTLGMLLFYYFILSRKKILSGMLITTSCQRMSGVLQTLIKIARITLATLNGPGHLSLVGHFIHLQRIL